MPNVLPVHHDQTRPKRRRSPLRQLLRPLVVLIGLALLLPMASHDPPPIQAHHGSCTAWTSKLKPPGTIRVGRSDGSVDVVDFRTYVGVVMASEWPGWVPEQAREAGAVAVKQYAWYYTLEGKHRSTYVNAKGRCYDVKDTTADQLYKPEKVSVGSKIWRVVDATWGLSVRKSGKFFQTGYRAGKSSVCASDVDGWKLFAKSVIDCANRGWSRHKIQKTYYAPDVTFHWADGSSEEPALALSVDPPVASLRTGKMLGQKHTLVTWDASGVRPSGMTYQLQRLIDGSWRTVSLADATRPRAAFRLAWGKTHQFRVRLRDSSGKVGPWSTGPRFDARLVQDKSSRMGWSPDDWKRQSVTKASGGTVTYTKKSGSQAALTFTGRAMGIVATRAPDRGVVKVVVDGEVIGEVDLYAPTYQWRVLVFTHEWKESVRRTVRVDVQPKDSPFLVDMDAILFYR